MLINGNVFAHSALKLSKMKNISFLIVKRIGILELSCLRMRPIFILIGNRILQDSYPWLTTVQSQHQYFSVNLRKSEVRQYLLQKYKSNDLVTLKGD